jgi:hypothetical protein
MATQPMGDELLTPGGVAALLLVNRQTVTRWALSGQLASTRNPAGHRRFLKSQMVAIQSGAYQRGGLPGAMVIPAQRVADGVPHIDPLPGSLAHQTALAASVLARAVALAVEVEEQEAARASVQVAANAALAAAKVAQAVRTAGRERAAAAEEARQMVAAQAALCVVQVQVRADAASAILTRTARRAVLAAMGSNDPVERSRSRVLASSAGLAAASTNEETQRAAEAVAAAVVAAAAHMVTAIAAQEQVIESQASKAASELQAMTAETAMRVTEETQTRAAGVARTARDAVAALAAAEPFSVSAR